MATFDRTKVLQGEPLPKFRRHAVELIESVKKPSKREPKPGLQDFAEQHLWFLSGDGQSLFSTAVRALAEETRRSTGVGTDADWTDHAIAAIGTLYGPDTSARTGISVVPAPVEMRSVSHEFTNSLGEKDEYDEDLERIITAWTPADTGSFRFILTIDRYVSRDEAFKQLREWFWTFSKQNPPSRQRQISARAVLFNLTVVRMNRVGFRDEEITRFVRQFDFLGRTEVTKDVVREARKYVRRLVKRIEHAATEVPF